MKQLLKDLLFICLYVFVFTGLSAQVFSKGINDTKKPAPLLLDKWTYLQLDSLRDHRVFGLCMGDLNDDGKNDIASGNWIYFNPGGDISGKWKRKRLPADVDILLIVNVDGDGHSDLIAEDGYGMMYWFEMQDKNGDEWYFRRFGIAGTGNHKLSTQGYITAQIETGGNPEIVISGGEQPDGTLYYFKIPQNPEKEEWHRVTVAQHVYPEGVAAADFDGDGNIDLGTTCEADSCIAWYENPHSGDDNWTKHFVGHNDGADRFSAGDMDGDSRPDIVVTGANGHENGIYWFKNPENPKTGKWIKRTVVNTGKDNSMNSMNIADMDQDGDLDIVSNTHMGFLKTSVWENDGNGNFTEHIIDTGKESHLGARLCDLDADGDLDIVSIAWHKYQNMHLWRNDAISVNNR